MAKKKEQKDNVGEANHIMRLVKTITAKMGESYLNANQRKVITELFDYVKEEVKRMESVDEEYQNLPENRIKLLQEELKNNDELLKKNKGQHTIMVQIGMIKRGYPQNGIMYDSMIEDGEFNIEELKMKIDSEFLVANPQFHYQEKSEWMNLQLENAKKQLKVSIKSLKEIKQQVEEVENDLTAQDGRMKARRIQIIEDLKKLGVKDIPQEKKNQEYIG